MTFEEVIKRNCESLPSNTSWWARFVFHYTDISNAIGILQSGTLCSRLQAQKEHLMKNDNASYQVIDMTSAAAMSYVRFYFRPLTPTQYFNEGYKHIQLRYCQDQNANVPVPIFFAFNIEKFLSNPQVKFSPISQAGYGATMLSGVEEFANLPFDKIYSDGPTDEETRKYRHAELLYPMSYPIMDSLEAILCRNEFEQSMLLALLRKESEFLFYTHKSKIRICRDKMFQKNGLFIQDIHFNQNKISISFSDTYEKRLYEQRQMQRNAIDSLSSIKIVFAFDWKNARTLLKQTSVELEFDYQKLSGVVFTIPHVDKSTILAVTVSCGSDLIGYKEFILNDII